MLIYSETAMGNGHCLQIMSSLGLLVRPHKGWNFLPWHSWPVLLVHLRVSEMDVMYACMHIYAFPAELIMEAVGTHMLIQMLMIPVLVIENPITLNHYFTKINPHLAIKSSKSLWLEWTMWSQVNNGSNCHPIALNCIWLNNAKKWTVLSAV